MRVKNPQNYTLMGFRKSNTKGKMYDGKLLNKTTNKIKYVPFGSNTAENYHDLTGLNEYPHLIHKDKRRRILFKKRHKKNSKYKYSSAWFSYNYLW